MRSPLFSTSLVGPDGILYLSPPLQRQSDVIPATEVDDHAMTHLPGPWRPLSRVRKIHEGKLTQNLCSSTKRAAHVVHSALRKSGSSARQHDGKKLFRLRGTSVIAHLRFDDVLLLTACSCFDTIAGMWDERSGRLCQ